jgi:glutathione S-transferase
MSKTDGGPPGKLRFVDVETARAARGVRLALLAGLPSPWSDGARALFATKGIDVLAVRYLPGDLSVTGWTGVPNAPAVMVDDERARSGWAEIIALAERLGPAIPLVPPGPAARARMFGLLHELLDEGGVAWSRRLLILDESFRPEDPARPRRGFPLPLAQGLAARYGYAPERVPAARARLVEALAHLDSELRAGGAASQNNGEGGEGQYFFGATLTALDFYAAAAVAALIPPDEALRPIVPALRPIFEHLDPEIAAAVTPALRAHRDRVYARHMRQRDA